MRKPKKGDVLFLVNAGINVRNAKEPRNCIVVKVGRKYFSTKEKVDSYFELQFYIDTWREKTDYSSNYALYENRQVWEEEKKAVVYREAFQKTFDYSGNSGRFTLYQLRGAAEILGIEIEGK